MVVRDGSLRLFKLFGITVWLHWSWLIVAYFMVQRNKDYSSPVWAVCEYLALFGIVLTHEFGHALACRSVGGKAETIMLWPLGGIAFVSPPMRPGAHLWSIFAGPLVNIVLLPITWGLAIYAGVAWPDTELAYFVYVIAIINTGLLIFNMLPVYPLDGGQILHSLLWFLMGYTRSLRVASVIGIIGAIALVGVAMKINAGVFTYVIIAFLGLQAYNGYRLAQFLSANPVRAQDPEPIVGEILLQEDPRQHPNNRGAITPPPLTSHTDQYRPPKF